MYIMHTHLWRHAHLCTCPETRNRPWVSLYTTCHLILLIQGPLPPQPGARLVTSMPQWPALFLPYSTGVIDTNGTTHSIWSKLRNSYLHNKHPYPQSQPFSPQKKRYNSSKLLEQSVSTQNSKLNKRKASEKWTTNKIGTFVSWIPSEIEKKKKRVRPIAKGGFQTEQYTPEKAGWT